MSDDVTAQSDSAGRNKRWALLGLGVVGAGLLGLYLGQQTDVEQYPDDSASGGKGAETAPALPASAATQAAVEETIRGVVNASSESTVASRMTARILALPFSEGQSFSAGAVLARFDCSQISAQLKAAQAASAAYRKTYETNGELDEFEAVGKNEVAVSKANLGKADAEANAISAQLSDCEVRAPFSGKVVEQLAHRNDVAASGQPLLKIQSGGDVELELIVPSNWLNWLRPGATFAFKIDETGNTVRGTVRRLGAAVDPVSKTIKVTGLMTERNGLILAGMSGTASFDDARARPAGSAAAVPAPVPVANKPVVNKPADGKPR